MNIFDIVGDVAKCYIIKGTYKKQCVQKKINYRHMSNVLVLGGGTGCVSNIVVDYLIKTKCNFITAGRTPYEKDKKIIHFKYDIFEKGSTDEIIKFAKKKNINCVINCICTGGKLSYDTTKIAFMNLAYMDTIVFISKELNASLIHFSSLKVGDINNNPYRLEKEHVWYGPRSPYAYSKYSAEMRLINSKYYPMSVLRIGLVNTKYGEKFYTRFNVVSDNIVNVTSETEIYEMLNKAICNKNKNEIMYINSSPDKCMSKDFITSFSNDLYLYIPHQLFDLFVNRCLPTKGLDYVSPNSSSEYLGF
jgi:dTDP-4-dehydrorhamnose reductase